MNIGPQQKRKPDMMVTFMVISGLMILTLLLLAVVTAK